MAKSVLGNDPFQRGAAPRVPAPVDIALPPPPARRAKPVRAPAPVEKAAPPAPPPQPPPAPERATALAPRFPGAEGGPLAWLRGAAKTAVAVTRGSWRAVGTGLRARDPADLDDFGQDDQLLEHLSPVAKFVVDHYWKLTASGEEQLPHGASLLVSNHSGALPYDGPVLAYAVRRARPDSPRPRWLVEDALLDAPALGTVLSRLGAVRITPPNALRLLGEDRPVIVFPEGLAGLSKDRSERHALRQFGRGGFVKIALRARVPIVPVAIRGADEAAPFWGKLPGGAFGLPYLPLTSPVPLRSRWHVRFGEPIELPRLDAEPSAEWVQEWAGRTRDAVQALLDPP